MAIPSYFFLPWQLHSQSQEPSDIFQDTQTLSSYKRDIWSTEIPQELYFKTQLTLGPKEMAAY